MLTTCRMSDKKNWSKDEIFSLISHWELYAELWDVKNKGYRNKIKKQNALNALSILFNTCESEIQRKLHNLRTQFHYELRRMEAKQAEDGSDEACYESSWEFFQPMSFLRAHSNPKTNDILENKSESVIQVKRKKPLIIQEEKKHDEISHKTVHVKEISTTDEFQIFGDFVACELRNLRSRENRNKLKRIIQRAIIDISEADDDESYSN